MRADVGVKDGRIVALAERLAGSAARVVDATGRYVMPGGIDSHCHIEQPSSTGGQNAESWESGTRSAACGGTTTVIAFSSQEKGEGVLKQVEAYHEKAKRACIDYSFHIIVSDPRAAVVRDELPGLIESGLRAINLVMPYYHNTAHP